MHRFLFVSGLSLALIGCTVVDAHRAAWRPADFARASNPEVVAVAAVVLRQYYAKVPESKGDHLYYLTVPNADWRDVIEKAGVPGLTGLIVGYRDHMVTHEGICDRLTGLQVYTIHIEIEGRIVGDGPLNVVLVHSAGTGLGTTASKMKVEKKVGEWIVIERSLQWAS